ncbi:hypothetical protein PLICRDRAFT_158792 [Plicaturopsis crispa FD-325 SS-3]|nr:hypothetical protein PLICRDRAFT_158792 [Plicaturopsis crispa FD-325 SS-3]
MPICTSCEHPVPYLYTVYESADNLRLEQCKSCHEFADPYVEHDELTLLLDLILLKRDVYRHLLYNRGSEPRRAFRNTSATDVVQDDDKVRQMKKKARENARWLLILRLGSGLLVVDAFIRWTHLNPNQPHDVSPWTRDTMEAFGRILIGCLVETVAFHIGVMFACYVVLNLLDRVRAFRRKPATATSSESGIRDEFRLSLVPLTIFYSSLTKLFLLFLLSIWRPNSSVAAEPSYRASFDNVFVSSALEILDEDKLDREWIVRNVLGGMAAGFGLRVILDCHPVFTTIIILVGWMVKTAAASLVSGWVGDEQTSEAFLAYSIP